MYVSKRGIIANIQSIFKSLIIFLNLIKKIKIYFVLIKINLVYK